MIEKTGWWLACDRAMGTITATSSQEQTKAKFMEELAHKFGEDWVYGTEEYGARFTIENTTKELAESPAIFATPPRAECVRYRAPTEPRAN